jgi:hypothetical protein
MTSLTGLPQNPGVARDGAMRSFRQSSPASTATAPLIVNPSTATPPDAFPREDQLGLTADELAEISAMTFSTADIERLSWIRQSPILECSSRLVPGEHVVITGQGYAPGSTVQLDVRVAPTDPSTRSLTIIADAAGNVSTSIIVPTDLIPLAGRPDHVAVLGVELRGTDASTAGLRIAGASATTQSTDSACAALLAAAGDISSDGQAAPSTQSGPAVPTVAILPSLLQAAECEADPAGMNVIIGTGDADNITGTVGRDLIIAGDGSDTIAAGNGDDIVCGGGGADTITSGNGNDHILGGSGNDTLNGENGTDTVSGDTGNDTLLGANGTDALDGGDGTDSADGGNGPDRCVSETRIRCEA